MVGLVRVVDEHGVVGGVAEVELGKGRGQLIMREGRMGASQEGRRASWWPKVRQLLITRWL